MAEERIDTGPATTVSAQNPDDIRRPGPGGGEQPATFMDSKLDINKTPPHLANRFDDPREDAMTNPADPAGRERSAEDELRDRIVEARDKYGPDVYLLNEGSELQNKSGSKVRLRTAAVVVVDGAGGDTYANDTKFAGFLHDSDVNWQTNIKQLDRNYNRATATPLPLMCERHGEDLEHEPYGRRKPCPKCIAEQLAEAEAAASPVLQRLGQQPQQPLVDPNPTAVTMTSEQPIMPGDVVERSDGETGPPMTVLSVEWGIANCRWFDDDGAQQEKTFGTSVLRRVRTDKFRDQQPAGMPLKSRDPFATAPNYEWGTAPQNDTFGQTPPRPPRETMFGETPNPHPQSIFDEQPPAASDSLTSDTEGADTFAADTPLWSQQQAPRLDPPTFIEPERREGLDASFSDTGLPVGEPEVERRTGELPADFPGRDRFNQAGVFTYAQLRRIEDKRAIPGIDEETAKRATERLASEE